MGKSGKAPVQEDSPKKRFLFVETEEFWFATGTRPIQSGQLFYCKKSGQFHANYCEPKILFPKLASGRYASEADCPVDKSHRPKSDFLLLLALRESFPTKSPGRKWEPDKWREMAIKARIAEREKVRGSPLPEANVATAMEIANSWTRFESYVGDWLVRSAQKPGAGDVFRRLARWLDAVEKIEKDGIPEEYLRFFKAVEAAANQAKGVPSKKAVRSAYEAELSANQIGSGEGARELMKRLRFTWLPNASRGPDAAPRKSGIR